MAFQVHQKAVVAQAGTGRARLEPGQVDRPRGELRQYRQQRTRPVGLLEHHDRGLVVSGRRRHPFGGDQHEPGGVLGVVLDRGRQHLEPVALPGQGVGQRRDPLVTGLGDRPGRTRGRIRGAFDHAWQRGVEEPPALAERHRHGGHRRDVAERRARHAEQIEAHRHDHLLLNQQLDLEGERVDGDVHHALEGVLDRHHPRVDLAVLGGVQHLGHRRKGHQIDGVDAGKRLRGLFAERRFGTEEADPRPTRLRGI